MDIELLLRVKEAILAEPKRLDMWGWLDTTSKRENPSGPECGTIGCISGWACVLKEKEAGGLRTFRGAARRLLNDGRAGLFAGAKILDLTMRQAGDLFEPARWPKDLDLHETVEGTPEHAETVARGIDRFIANGGHW